MKYHYYIGIQLPSPLRGQIEDLQAKLFDPIESIEPLEPHITLLPPQCVGEVNPDSLAIHIKAAATSDLPFDITLTKVITFESHAVALKAESKVLHGLQEQLAALLPFESEIDYYPEPKFTPHVTLVQAIHGRKLPSKLVEAYTEAAKELLPVTFTVDHLTLFEWEKPRKYRAKTI